MKPKRNKEFSDINIDRRHGLKSVTNLKLKDPKVEFERINNPEPKTLFQDLKFRYMYHLVNEFKNSQGIKNGNLFQKVINNPGNINRDRDMWEYKMMELENVNLPKYFNKTNNFEAIMAGNFNRKKERIEPNIKDAKPKYLSKSVSAADLVTKERKKLIWQLQKSEIDRTRATLVDKYVPKSESFISSELKYLINNKQGVGDRVLSCTTMKNFFVIDRDAIRDGEVVYLNAGGDVNKLKKIEKEQEQEYNKTHFKGKY